MSTPTLHIPAWKTPAILRSDLNDLALLEQGLWRRMERLRERRAEFEAQLAYLESDERPLHPVEHNPRHWEDTL